MFSLAKEAGKDVLKQGVLSHDKVMRLPSKCEPRTSIFQVKF
jgi:hypothetical protein